MLSPNPEIRLSFGLMPEKTYDSPLEQRAAHMTFTEYTSSAEKDAKAWNRIAWLVERTHEIPCWSRTWYEEHAMIRYEIAAAFHDVDQQRIKVFAKQRRLRLQAVNQKLERIHLVAVTQEKIRVSMAKGRQQLIRNRTIEKAKVLISYEVIQ